MRNSTPPVIPDRSLVETGKNVDATGSRLPASPANSLAAMAAQKPNTKFGQLQHRWPEIKAALRAGHRLQQVRGALAEDGLELSYSKLRSYVARLKRMEASGADLPGAKPDPEAIIRDSPPAASTTRRDPLSNLRDRLNRRSGFEFDERPPDEKKLI